MSDLYTWGLTDWAQIITAFAVVVIPFAIYFLRRSHESRTSHFQQLKEVVIARLKEHVDDFYLPTLKGQQGVVYVIADPRFADVTSVADHVVGYEYRLDAKNHHRLPCLS